MQESSALPQRFLSYFLIGVLSPAILFTFAILFGSGSYQEWNDRFHYELTNRYLFSRIETDTALGPLWRDDILSGSVWATNKGSAPVAMPIVVARIWHLSPVWMELLGNLILYWVAAISMYLYVCRELSVGLASGTVAAVMFGATAYWLSYWVGNPDLPMATASLPALLVLCHQIARSTEQRSFAHVLLSVVALALVFYGCAVHSVLASFPATLTVVVAYTGTAFGVSLALLWTLIALGLGLVLYSPFLWSVVEAVRLSGRFVVEGFLQPHQVGVNPSEWIANAKLVFSQVAVGHNQYGIYVGTVAGVLAWLCLGDTWCREPPRIRRILGFLGIATAAFLVCTIFDTSIDYLKQKLPLVGAWHVRRFEHLMFFPVVALFAWMLDRSLFRPPAKARDVRRVTTFRVALVVAGGIAGLQIGYSAFRMRLVPALIFPQNLMLYAYLVLYAAVTAGVLVLLYSATRQYSATHSLLGTQVSRDWFMALMVMSVSLVTSVHAYRAGVLPPKTGVAGKTDPIMTYAQRYSVPSDIRAIKELNKSDGRVVDLTRPWYADALGPASETTLLPLGGLRTPSGYNLAPGRWYEQFVNFGINGHPRMLKYIVQVENSPETNFEALGLLDVQYILARQSSVLPGYVPVLQFPSSGKALYAPQDGTLVSPAFLSAQLRCFETESDALKYIHGTGLRQLKREVILVANDPETGLLCPQRDRLSRAWQANSPSIHTYREHDRVRVEVEGTSGGVLSLADSYYPGWKVYVNGKEQPLLRTYTALRGVAVEPGRSTVDFVYAPAILRALYRLSNGMLLLLLLLLLTFLVWNFGRSSSVDSGGVRYLQTLFGQLRHRRL